MTTDYKPQAIFDNAEFLNSNSIPNCVPKKNVHDYHHAKKFLLSYQHNLATFNSFRRDIERFAQYCWFIAKKSMTDMHRTDIEEYLLFCQKPPTTWIGNKSVARFTTKEGIRIPSNVWRPFLVTVSKSDRRQGKTPKRNQYRLSEKGFREIFTILNCFYNFLLQEEISEINPISQIKQKNRFYRSHQTKPKVRRISELQWRYVIETAEKMAERDPNVHQRTLFIISALYGLYLRISELAASARWIPTMNDFEKDSDANWWFTTVGKGNKERRIAVSRAMLKALKDWRKYLNLSPILPSVNDNSPLIPKQIGQGAVTDTRHLRRIVQICFDESCERLRRDKLADEADALAHATVHWLRHTGISDDVKIRPREHVRDDAGHSSSSITDKYIDIDLRERHASANNKRIKND